MANAVFGFQNRADTGTLTTTSQANGLPVDNLKNEHVAKVWRTQTSTTTASVIVDALSSLSVQLIGLIGSNLTAAATFRIRMSDSDPTGATGELYDQSVSAGEVDPVYRSFIHVMASAVTGRYTRIDITDASLDYIEAGRLFVGPYWQPSIGVQFGIRQGYADPSTLDTSLGGQVFIDRKTKARRWTFSLDFVTAAESNAGMAEMDRLRSGTEDVLMVLYTDSTNLGRDSIWGLLSSPSGIETAYSDTLKQSYVITERL